MRRQAVRLVVDAASAQETHSVAETTMAKRLSLGQAIWSKVGRFPGFQNCLNGDKQVPGPQLIVTWRDSC